MVFKKTIERERGVTYPSTHWTIPLPREPNYRHFPLPWSMQRHLEVMYSQKEVSGGSKHLLFLPLSPPLSLTGLLSNSFRKPREPAFPWNLLKWHNISRFAYAKRVKQQALAAQLTYCLLWQAELFPWNNSVTKWASCECHLGNTYLRLAEVPWQPALRGGGKGE